MLWDERAEFLRQSIVSHDRKLCELRESAAKNDRRIGELTEAIAKLVIVSNENATVIRTLARIAEAH
jgi:uncharacterized protein YigA (DUF484 family)